MAVRGGFRVVYRNSQVLGFVANRYLSFTRGASVCTDVMGVRIILLRYGGYRVDCCNSWKSWMAFTCCFSRFFPRILAESKNPRIEEKKQLSQSRSKLPYPWMLKALLWLSCSFLRWRQWDQSIDYPSSFLILLEGLKGDSASSCLQGQLDPNV